MRFRRYIFLLIIISGLLYIYCSGSDNVGDDPFAGTNDYTFSTNVSSDSFSSETTTESNVETTTTITTTTTTTQTFSMITTGTIKIGSFNIKFLGDGVDDTYNPRTSQDYQNIATVISSNGFDLLGLQEIENAAAVDLVVQHLPETYQYVFQNSGWIQNLVLLYNASKVNVLSSRQLSELKTGNLFLRIPLFAELQSGSYTFSTIVVHLKAGSDTDSQNRRTQEAEALNTWINDYLDDSANDPDILLLGDLNSQLNYSEIDSLRSNSRLRFISSELSGEGTYISWNSLIDHIVVSQDSEDEYVDNSIDVYYFDNVFPSSYDGISDHRPIFGSFVID